MSGPFIFIATNRLKPGKLADERRRVPGLVDQVFGMPSNVVLEMLERQAGGGVPLSVKPFHLGGFTR